MATFWRYGLRSPVGEDGQDPAFPDAPPPLIAKFEMAITAADLERLYRYIPGGENAKFDGCSATLKTGDRGWSMRISNSRIRSMGLLSLPLASVEIEAWGHTVEEFNQLVERILLVFRRGGG